MRLESVPVDVKAARRLESRLGHIRARLDTDDSGPTLWRAYMFAMLTVRTSTIRAESAFRDLARAAPRPEMFEATLAAEILRRANVNFWQTKVAHLARAAPLVRDIAPKLQDLSDKGKRLLLASTLPGISFTKASFTLMLVGFLDVACLDSHMCELLGTDERKAQAARGRYERLEARVRRHGARYGLARRAGLTQWLVWTAYLGITDAHMVYFEAQLSACETEGAPCVSVLMPGEPCDACGRAPPMEA